MVDTETGPGQHGGRRRLVGYALLVIAVLAIVALLVSSPWSGDDKPAATRGAARAADAPGTSSTAPTTSAGGTTSSTVPVPTTAVQVPIATVNVNGPGGACAAVVARLKIYSAAAKQSAVTDLRTLFEQLSEFEDEIFQNAQGQAWGDRMVEQLVVVRRGWVDAGSAFDSGDKAAATKDAAKANKLLDHVIATAPC